MTTQTTQIVDLATREGIYQATGLSPEYAVGDKVMYSQRGQLDKECEIEYMGVEYGRIIYGNSLGKWGYESQYHQTIGTMLNPVKS